MVWGMFSWRTLAPLIPVGGCLDSRADLSIMADQVPPFMAEGHCQQDDAPRHKGQIVMDWFQ